jgi:DNA polymerase I
MRYTSEMAAKTLADFFDFAEATEKQSKNYVSNTEISASDSFSQIQELPPSYLLSADYEGKKRVAYVKLYEPQSEKIYNWYDTTGHKPYCLTNITQKALKKIDRLMLHRGFDHLETVKKYDALLDQDIEVTKVVAKDPLAVGGATRDCIRDIIPKHHRKVAGTEQQAKVWEARIKYYQSYIYDRSLAPGMLYKVHEGKLVHVNYEEASKVIKRIRRIFKGQPEENLKYLESWAHILECPIPKFRRLAIDIEVLSLKNRLPDPEKALQPIIAVSILGSDGEKRVLLSKREGVESGNEELPPQLSSEYYDSEIELIKEVFNSLTEYPIVVTFNGDDFDLRYLWHRAINLGLEREQIPIEAGRRACLLKNGIHLDLYRFFHNKSIQIYAFGRKYSGVTLDEVGEALIKMPKIKTKWISELTYTELARYCFRDAEITFNLTAFDNDLVMKLMLILTRISRMPIEDVSRQGVSRWIRSFLQWEHRSLNRLIPNSDDILTIKGTTSTKAVIKGKKYKGGIVVEPTPGVHFDVAVMDFSSLYPSIIKVHNLGYSSIRCHHTECRENTVPQTPHWICRKNRSLESLLIGSLRDLRVMWYKPKSKDETKPKELRSWYHVVQSALKVILNASYGVFGAESFDLYCPPAAEATTAIGRHSITETIKKARELGINVVYGDTDSVFLKAPSQKQVKDLTEWSEEVLGMDLDLDKVYRYAVFSSRKKNYLGVFPDGSVDIKGLTGKKSHVPLFLKKAFLLMADRLSRVESPAEFGETKKEIQKVIRDCYMKLKRRKYSLEELAFHVMLGKDPEAYVKTLPQHVKAARLLQKSGEEVKAGQEINFVKIVGALGVKPVQLATEEEVDIEKYVGYMRSTFGQVLDALGLDFDEMIGLTKLERFM